MSSVAPAIAPTAGIRDRPRRLRGDIVGRAVGILGGRDEALRARRVQIELDDRVRRRHRDAHQRVAGRRIGDAAVAVVMAAV